MIETLEQFFGPYPFEAQGGIVDSGLGFALENQTRPVYDGGFFFRGSNTSVVAHELAHQWFGDSVSVRDWREIWLNEGFASYAEYLWSDVQGEGTPAELAQFVYDIIPADDEFWQVLPGDPGAANQFHDAVYDRGAMTLQALRTAVGDDAFFKILRRWPAAPQVRHGDDRAVHRAGGADLRSAARRPVHHLAVHGRQARGRPERCDGGGPHRAGEAQVVRRDRADARAALGKQVTLSRS